MRLKSVLAGVVGALMVSSAAMAADIVYVAPPAPPPPPPPAPAGFDWAGPYAGIGYTFPVFLGGQFGYNFAPNNFLFGLEGSAKIAVVAPVFLFQVKARLGVILGAEDRVLLYGAGGVAGGSGPLVATAGAGLAIGFRQRPISWFIEGDFAIGPGALLVTTGINFHFGN